MNECTNAGVAKPEPLHVQASGHGDPRRSCAEGILIALKEGGKSRLMGNYVER